MVTRTVPLFCLVLLAAAPARAGAPCHESPPAAEVRAGESIYQLDGTFQDQRGVATTRAAASGGPVIVSMFYGTCPQACPLLIARIKAIEGKLPPLARQRLKVILVSLDPARDTPASMEKLAAAHRVDASRWSLLRTADEDRIRELAAVLGVRYRFLPDGSINHSSVITLLDREGRIASRVDGLDAPVKTLVAAATRVAAGG